MNKINDQIRLIYIKVSFYAMSTQGMRPTMGTSDFIGQKLPSWTKLGIVSYAYMKILKF